jgi:predicted transcriptional regulator of viral defense system
MVMAAHLSKSFRPRDFFEAHRVFTHAEFLSAHTAGGRSPHTTNGILAQHVASGRLLRVKRGVYATVPPGTRAERFAPDPYLVATKMQDDAVVAYHSALSFHGKAYSSWSRVQYLTGSRVRPLAFRGVEYIGLQPPPAVRETESFGGGISIRPHAGGEVRVASLERCLVDLLHTPKHGGSWEEIWRSLEMIEFLDLNAVVEWALQMDSPLTAGRVGFFLEQHREEWMVEDVHLAALAQRAPTQPRYLDHQRTPGKLLSPWNLIVPEHVLQRRWEEA